MTAKRKIIDYLFPDIDRTFQGMRWVNITLRALHLIGVAGVGGAFLYNTPLSEWWPYFMLTFCTGLLLMSLAIWSNGIWLLQLRGVATIVKLALLSISFAEGMESSILFSIIAISGVISHAPGKVRYYMVFSVPRFN